MITQSCAPRRILLAPMEGLADAILRDVLTRKVQYHRAVTEFCRVADTPLPAKVFHRISPELQQGGKTLGGTPVAVQLLGADPERLAESARRLAELGPAAIDLNFGCPAPMVNRHRGGAILLEEPELLYRILLAVRAAVPPGMPVTAKMRLGFADTAKALDCARALAEGGAGELVVHARTRSEGYRPPAHWPWIARIAEAVSVPVVANGEVWSLADWQRCRAESGQMDIMLGRGAVADPFLADRLRGRRDPDPTADQGDWADILPLLAAYWQQVTAALLPHQSPGRLKHWLGFLEQRYPQARALRAEIRALKRPGDIDPVLAAAGAVPAGRAAGEA